MVYRCGPSCPGLVVFCGGSGHKRMGVGGWESLLLWVMVLRHSVRKVVLVVVRVAVTRILLAAYPPTDSFPTCAKAQ